MSRQAIGVTVVILILAALVAVRAFTGHGAGRIYTKTVTTEMVEVQQPVADPAGVDPEAARQGTVVTEGVWVAVDSEEARKYAAEGAPTISWTQEKDVPYNVAQASAGDESIKLNWPRTLGVWLAAFLTLAIFSFLYKDNAIYKTAESLVVGVSAAYWMVVGFWDIIIPNLVGRLAPAFVDANFTPGLTDLDPQWRYLIPAIFGVLLLMRLAPKGQWLSLWTLAFIVGTTAALRMVAYIEGDFISQIDATIKPLYQVVFNADDSVDGYATFWASVRQLILLVGVLSCLTYFFFSLEHKGAVGKVARVGIWFLMITFGAAFGMTVMGRITLLAARFEFLFNDWLWIIDPNNARVIDQTMSLLIL